MSSFYVADTAALAAINTADPKGDGTVTLPVGFVMFVLSPGNNSPSASFILKDDSTILASIENWAVVPTAREGGLVWLNTTGITAADNTPPSFTPSNPGYTGLEWKSKYTDILNGLQWIEKWIFDGVAWNYVPSVTVANVSPNINPIGQGSLYYDGATIYIANYDLSGWTRLISTYGVS